MRRIVVLPFLLVCLIGCRRKATESGGAPAKITPDPAVSASASAAASSAPAFDIPADELFASDEELSVVTISDDVAYVDFGNRVGRTLDGGAHWTWFDFPPASGAGWIVVAPDGVAWDNVANGTQGDRIVRILEDGVHEASPKLPSIPSDARFGPLYVIDRDVAFMSYSSDVTPTRAALLSTHDGGATWSSSEITTPKQASFNFAGVDRDHLWAAGELSSEDRVVLFATKNGGKTWTRLPDPPASGQPNMPDGCRVSFLDATRGFFLGNGTLDRTADGGRTWKRVIDGVDLDTTFRMPTFVGDEGIAIGGKIKSTSDGGETWVDLGASSYDTAQHGTRVWSLNSFDGLVSEMKPDGSWIDHAKNPRLKAAWLTQFEAATDRTGWIVFQTKPNSHVYRILYSHDSGATWTPLTK